MHTFLIYKDLEDLATEQFGYPHRYSKRMSSIYFVVDPQK